ncbi:MAG: YqgE/AlgH family protein [Planctomycetes bacterium]|nr:YqgE/AlgH family protein [Planctomycetota bacterium]
MAVEWQVAPGSFLAAGPDLTDPNFAHSVVLMCRHDEEGAYGLVINRPSDVRACDVLQAHAELARSRARMFVGGPVALESLQVLHRVPERIDGGEELVDGLFVGGDLDALARYLNEAPEEAERNVRLFMGYSGWGPGQLEFELSAFSWLPAPGALSSIFSPRPQAVWRDVVRGLGPRFRPLADEPPDPYMN